MSRGLAYDSQEGRDYAAALTAIMHGEAYRADAGHRPRPRRPVQRIQEERAALPARHRASIATPRTRSRRTVSRRTCSRRLARSTTRRLELGREHGYRNAQVTVLAPTGTIAFMMDCDTTGIEPDIALIKYKKLVGEGFLKIVNQTVPAALKKLGYGADAGRRDPRPTSTSARRSRARRTSSRSTCRSSTAPSSRSTASAPSTTWATSG